MSQEDILLALSRTFALPGPENINLWWGELNSSVSEVIQNRVCIILPLYSKYYAVEQCQNQFQYFLLMVDTAAYES